MTERASGTEREDERLAPGGGSFRDRALEAAFEADQLPVTRRHARFLFAASALLNTGFLPVDWRFFGTPHFWIAMPARLAVITVSLLCLLLVRRTTQPRALHATLIAWMAGVAIGVALLVTSRSLLARYVVVILPVIYYVAVPVPFRWSMIGGVTCSFLLLLGFAAGQPYRTEDIGIVLAALTLNVALAMSVARANGHARRAWAAARSARRLGDALAVSRSALERMFLASPVPLVLTSADGTGRVRAISHSAAALLDDPCPETLRQYYAAPGAADPLAEALARDGGASEIEVVATLGGAARTLVIKAGEIDLPDGRAILAGLVDITERKAVQVNLEQIAATDALTGLRNRLSFFAIARAEMTRAARASTPLCLLMVDIDHFKRINDTHGHNAGDAVLRTFAAISTEAVGPDAIVGRLGGEEFGILLPGHTLDAAQVTAERLREAVAGARTACAGAHIAMTISIGAARVLPLERDLDQPLARADVALYSAKRNGRNCVAVDGAGRSPARAGIAGRRTPPVLARSVTTRQSTHDVESLR